MLQITLLILYYTF